MRLLVLPHILLTLPCQGALVAYWNFNDLTIASADTPGSGSVPSSIFATQGSGSLSLVSWSGTVDDFAGSSINTLDSDPAGESLSLIAGSGMAGNGSNITLEFSLTGMVDPVLSFATQSTATGFNSVQLAWSVNGADFYNFDTAYDPATSYSLRSFDLSSVNSLDGVDRAYFQLSFDGATGTSGNNRIDNIQLTAITEPSTALLLLAATTSISLLRRR